MAIAAIAAVAAKEAVAVAIKEVATKSALEASKQLAEKIATEISKTSELQPQVLENQSAQTEAFKVGEMNDIGLDKEKEVESANDLHDKIKSELDTNEEKDAEKAESEDKENEKDKLEDHEVNNNPDKDGVEQTSIDEGLSEADKSLIKEETGWSDEIIDNIKDMDQYDIYKKANLHEEEVDGRPCLCKDIDLDYVDDKTGLTNRELMEKGYSPYDAKTGDKIELHHMGQNYDSPFAELTEKEHGDGNHGVLHNNKIESWRRDEVLDKQYKNVDKPQHWENRAIA